MSVPALRRRKPTSKVAILPPQPLPPRKQRSAQVNPMPPAARPPVIIKKKITHAGHHGGAWKVAYADFVTAMMALFIVLWLMNTSKQIQEAVGGYFKDPTGTSKRVGSDMVGSGENFVVDKDNMEELKEQLQKAIREVPDFDKLKNHIDMTVTNEGLRIELTESATGTFFDSGSSKISREGYEILQMLAQELGKLPTKLPSRATRIPSPTPRAPPTPIGSFPPIVPTPLAASCSPAAFASTKSPRSAASPISAFEKRKTLSIRQTAASLSSSSTSRKRQPLRVARIRSVFLLRHIQPPPRMPSPRPTELQSARRIITPASSPLLPTGFS